MNVEALNQGLDEIVGRHEALRTTFSDIDGKPLQSILASGNPAFSIVDLRHLAEGEVVKEAYRLGFAEANRPFNLGAGPLIRITDLRLAEHEHWLLVTVHHIVWDGWSSSVFFQELESLYEFYGFGDRANFPSLPIQYADFACWQRDWLNGDTLEQQLDYWRQNLAGADAVVDLPSDRPRPPMLTRQGARHSIDLPIEEINRIKSGSRREGVTLFMTLMGGLKVLLHRYTAQTDIVVGSPIAGRNRIEIEDLIGFFVNTLAMRSQVSGNMSFKDVLRGEKEAAMGAYGHQDVPFEKLVEELEPERDLARNPIFQVMFVLQNGPEVVMRLSGMKVTPITIHSETAKFDLSLDVVERAEGLRIGFEYSKDLFDHTTIERLANHYSNVLNRVVDDTGRLVSDIGLLTPMEKHQLEFEWNDTCGPVGGSGDALARDSIGELFDGQARMTPDSVAAVQDEIQISYELLNRRANQLANYLLGQDLGLEFVAGICFDRSIEMLVAMAGVLKAGGAYLPIDASYPPERLALIFNDLSPRILLTQDRFRGAFSALIANLVCLDSNEDVFASQSDGFPSQITDVESLAYIMYTSGSTGGPKGVSVRHRSVLRLVKGVKYADLGPDEVILQFAPASFDASTFEIWGALLNGGRVALASAQKASLEEIGDIIQQQQITTLWLTAGLFHQMVDGNIEGLKGVRQLLAGGDVLSVPHARRLLDQYRGHLTLINGYGPTENTTFTCCNPISSSQQLTADSFPIGRPIADTQIRVLDRLFGEAPIGVVGELTIGGDGLARVYANRPALTAERFVPDPFSAKPGLRLYRTGDLVRTRPNSDVQFLGRFDNQVKVRGFRIELGEIESALSGYCGLRESVVTACIDEDGDKTLVAYLVMDSGIAANTSELRGYLKDRLPEYMVPSSYVVLEQFPLTANGKINRQALPKPNRLRNVIDGELAPARTPVEEVIRGIWADVLKLDELGIHDNFFELGGHSLLATQVVSRIRKILSIEVPLRLLFEFPTVAGMARGVEIEIRRLRKLQVPPIERVPRDEFLPLSYAQERLWFVGQLLGGGAVYNTALPIHMEGAINLWALEQSLGEIARRHEALRTTLPAADGRPAQRIHEFRPMQVAVVDLRDLTDSHPLSIDLIKAEAQKLFDLDEGPLLRAAVLRISDDEHILLLTVHHTVFDGWSLGIFTRELKILHEQCVNGRPSAMPEIEIQYADFSVWQRRWLEGQVLDKQVAYWTGQMEGAPEQLELPADHSISGTPRFEGGTHRFWLAKGVTDQLYSVSRAEGVTLFMALMSGLTVL
ncbi:MAG TPA: amino acid adenylation domain-containing protein, partial [Blastocatellia bacterium]|nr:amino acid adenylation domain-containing protein [Blastocatellia bacterium]